MARVLIYSPDLLFGSQTQGSLLAAGHEALLVGDWDGVASAVAGVDAFTVDLTAEPSLRVSLFESLSREGALGGVKTLAFYSHVDADVRQAAVDAGFDLVVPRSRMAREGAELITRVATPPKSGLS